MCKLLARRSFVTFLFYGLATALSVGPTNGQEPREQIGETLGKPVYRDQIATGKDKDIDLRDELFRLIANPAIEKYRQAHKAEITPTNEEIDFAAAFFDKEHRERIKADKPKLRAQLKAVQEKLKYELSKEQRQQLEIEHFVLDTQLKPPGRFFAEFVLRNWKFQRYLYDQYGGGRILWQQAGLEAFDATRKWLESLESKGELKFTDPNLRAAFYEYWTRDSGVFLKEKTAIREEFLEPAWAPKRPKTDVKVDGKQE